MLSPSEPARREKIVSVFLVHHIAAWDALAGIYEAMTASADFSPIVISIPFNFNSARQNIFDGEDDIHRALHAMKVPHLRFNFEDHAQGLAKLKSLQPDILFRQSPWDPDIPAAYSTNALDFTRIVYTDYGIGILQDSPGNIRIDYDQELHRRAWMLLCANDEQKRIYETRTEHKGLRAVVTGYPKFDKLVQRGRDQKSWPIKSTKRKFRLIWAPHHSVRPEHLGFGTFPLVFPEILRWIFRNPDVEVVLKPHPMLFESCAHGMMTRENVETFLKLWQSQPRDLDRRRLRMTSARLSCSGSTVRLRISSMTPHSGFFRTRVEGGSRTASTRFRAGGKPCRAADGFGDGSDGGGRPEFRGPQGFRRRDQWRSIRSEILRYMRPVRGSRSGSKSGP